MAKELVRANPDVLVAMTTPATAALQAETSTIPIVFAAVSDPVGSGFVVELARPGGNITGFIDIEGSMGGKWLELLREIAPFVSCVAFHVQSADRAVCAILPGYVSSCCRGDRDPSQSRLPFATRRMLSPITKLGLKGGPGDRDAGSVQWLYFQTIRTGRRRNRLPTMFRFAFPLNGGLVSYGVDYPKLLQGAAAYADRILQGAKPGELQVQMPTKFEFVINVKIAKSLGLSVSPSWLTRADEVIE